MGPAHEDGVHPYHEEGSDGSPDQALHQPLKEKWRPDEAIRCADELHNLYLLAPGEDREPYGVEDEQDARRKEQDRRRPKPPDHVAHDLIQAVYGLLRITEIPLRKTLGLELVGDRSRVARVVKLYLEGGRKSVAGDTLVDVGLIGQHLLEAVERFLLGDIGALLDLGVTRHGAADILYLLLPCVIPGVG